MKFKSRMVFLLVLPFFIGLPAHGQIMKKVKQKLNQEKERIINETLGLEETSEQSSEYENSSRPNGKPTNEFKGKKMTPPDVNKFIDQAITAYDASEFTDSRYAVQQALHGLEIEIGHAILDNLPSAISKLPARLEEDAVSSSGFGWIGLIIHREYWDDDKAIDISVANHSMLAGAYGAMFGSGVYGDEQFKSIQVHGIRSTLHYDENNGQYQLGVPLGQSTAMGFDFTNFESEEEVLAAAEQVDLNGIKALLGEK